MGFIHKLHHFFFSNHIFFPANEEATLKTKQSIRFQGLFKVTNQTAGKWKTKSIMWQILQFLFPKLLFLISNWLSTASIKYFNWPSHVFGRFQTGWVKFPHSPILHYAFSSWIEKTMTKTIHCHCENRFVLQ